MQRPPFVKHNTICRMWSKSDVCIRIFDTKGQEVQVTSCKLVALWFEHAVILGKQYINFVSLTWWSTIERKWKKELEANQNIWEAKVKLMVVLKKGCIKDAAKCKLQRAYMPYAGRGGRIAQMPLWPREGNVVQGWPTGRPHITGEASIRTRKTKKQAPMGILVEQVHLECICSFYFSDKFISSFQMFSQREKVFLFGWGMGV